MTEMKPPTANASPLRSKVKEMQSQLFFMVVPPEYLFFGKAILSSQSLSDQVSS